MIIRQSHFWAWGCWSFFTVAICSNLQPFISTKSWWRGRMRHFVPIQEPWGGENEEEEKVLEIDDDALLTFWTVVVRSRHSWMILFFVTEKSVIPVNGALGRNRTLFTEGMMTGKEIPERPTLGAGTHGYTAGRLISHDAISSQHII